jgi:hypothetical protein
MTRGFILDTNIKKELVIDDKPKNKGQFKKGQSGNPSGLRKDGTGGRPKKIGNF